MCHCMLHCLGGSSCRRRICGCRRLGWGSSAASGTVRLRGIVDGSPMLQNWRRGQVGTLLPALLHFLGGLKIVRGDCRDVGIGRAVGGGFCGPPGTVRPRVILGGSSMRRLCWRWQSGPLWCALVEFWGISVSSRINDPGAGIGATSDWKEVSLKASAPRSRAPLSSEAVVVSIACSMQY